MRIGQWRRTERKYRYPPSAAHPITHTRPDRPAALMLYDALGRCWVLAFDFDPKRHGRRQVTDDCADAAAWFTGLGASVITDVAVSGGRHLWVPLTAPTTVEQVRTLMRACQSRWPSLDTTPASNVTEGCLTAPGSVCKDRQARRLTTPLTEAITAVRQRSPADLIAQALLQLGADTAADRPTPCVVTLPDRAGTALRAEHLTIAVTGVVPDRTTKHGDPWSRSEACNAVVSAAAVRGWTAARIIDQMTGGAWPGLLSLYEGRYPSRWQHRLEAEHAKALHDFTTPAYAAGVCPRWSDVLVGDWRTAEQRFVRRWLTITDTLLTAHVPARQRIRVRALTHAVAYLAWRTGSRVIEAGTRSYARASGALMDHTTVADLLHLLRDLPAEVAPLRLLRRARGVCADRLELLIPAAFTHHATDPSTWTADPRPIPAVFGLPDPDRPGRRVLGAAGWALHQALLRGVTGTPADIAVAAGVSRTRAYVLLPALARHGLATHHTTGWQAGASTAEQASSGPATREHLARLDSRDRRDRRAWRRWLATRPDPALTEPPAPPPDDPAYEPPPWPDEEPTAGAAADDANGDAAVFALLTEMFAATLIPASPRPAKPAWIGQSIRAGERAARLTSA